MKVGDYVHYSVAHGEPADIWAVILADDPSRTNDTRRAFYGKVVAGSNASWSVGSTTAHYDPPDTTPGAPRFTVVPEEEVPDEVWARIARDALLA